MAEQKIFPQQITVTGSTNGQVLTANTTSNTAYWAPANSWLTTVTSKNIIPAASNTYNLGSPTRRYKDLFLSGATLYLGNTVLSSTKKGSLTIQGQGSATTQTLVANAYLTSVYIANTAARTLINARLQVANATTLLAAKATWAALTSTNTAIRAYVDDHLQVANAVATYLTKNNPIITGTLTANGSVGTAGYYLRTSGAGVYWSPASSGGGGGTFTGGTVSGATVFSSDVTLSSTLTAGASVGTSGQALVSTGTGVQWGALSPGYNFSSQFGGGNQYLGITASNAAFGFGTGEFTIEGWFYPTLNPANGVGTIFEFRTTTNASATTMRINTSLQLVFYNGPANVETAFTTRTVSLNTWQHVAFVRIGNTVYGYINGLLAGSVAVTSNLGSSQPFYIGANQTAGYNYYGLASNVRVIKGTGIYTGVFTPPTSPLSAISGTSVLTCNAITPTSDSSTNAFQFTNGNGVTTTATLSPFTSTTVSIPTQSLTAVRQQFTGDGSTTSFSVAGGYTPNAISVFVNGVLLRNGTEVTVTNGSTVVFAIAPLSGALIDVIGTVPTTYSSITPVSYSTQFNGTSQYLSVPTNAAFSLTGDFTIEAWVYLTTATGTKCIFTNRSTTGAAGLSWTTASGSQALSIYTNGGFSATSSSSILLNTWTHVALTRSGSTITQWLNGVNVGTVTNSSSFTEALCFIGSNNSGTENWPGYISNFRLVKGVAVYTNNFTVPSSPLAITQSASGAYIQAITGTQTSLLTCNGPTIIDGSTNAFTITNNGSAPVSTAIVPTFTNVTINNPTLYYSATYLIVAGGGGGGGTNTVSGGGGYVGGGGGAGGLLTGITTLITGTTCTVTVGSGGAAGTSSGSPTVGASGTNSVLVAPTTLTAIGGGGGGFGGSGATGAGLSGGSGGGAGSQSGAGGSGTSGQGFAGGTSASGGTGYASGGGGSSAFGTSAISSAVNAGGAGTASSITGTSVTYAAGGNGGGGSTNATTNTGNGGPTASSNGGAYAGGSGVVIISIPTVNYTGRTTGSPTVTTSGTNTILKFTASGTYTA